MIAWQDIFNLNDGILYWKISPYKKIKASTKAGTIRKDGYVVIGYKNKRYYAHRIIFKMVHGYEPKLIDHLNGDKSYNDPSNLRDATYQQNSRNRCGTAKSGVKGVYWIENRQRWVAMLNIEGKTVHAGRFKDIKDAETAIISLRKQHHKEFTNNDNQKRA